jgi:mannose/cellobiose epimerase-like protein (N-acyl-D-glucosamine 2-epimerase family)
METTASQYHRYWTMVGKGLTTSTQHLNITAIGQWWGKFDQIDL